jgi:hypothetical protein
MKWIIQDYTLYDPSVTNGEFDTAEQAINHLSSLFDHIWPNQWFIKRNCGVYKLGVFNSLDTDSFAIVAIVKQRPETRAETRLRQLNQLHNKLTRDCDDLSEFLLNDYGDSVDQLGMERVRELEAKLHRQQHIVGLLRDRIDVLERKLAK